MPKQQKSKTPTKNKKTALLAAPKKEQKRVIEKPKYKTLRLHKRIKHPTKKIIGSFTLMRENVKHLFRFKKLFLIISIVYFVLSLILVSGLTAANDYAPLKETLQALTSGSLAQVSTGVALFGVFIGGGGSSISEAGSIFQTLLTVVISLCVIWALRQTYARTRITAKQAFYKSMTPLIPFILVLLVIGLQLLPLLVVGNLYTIVVTQGQSLALAVWVLWLSLMGALVLLTLYMITSSVFALYIVTLPDVTPLQALRSARELVRYRRWSIMRKVLFLPCILILFAAVIMIPILLYLTAIAQFVFIFLTMLALVVVHGYMYRLYRELL